MRIILIVIFILIAMPMVKAQEITIYYTPVEIPPQLRHDYFGGFDSRALAGDLAYLLGCATGKKYKISPFAGEKKGIFLLLDTSLRDSTNETGHLSVTKKSVVIRSKYTTGLSFAMYSWLQELGFRFYLPGDTWMDVPQIRNIFQPLEKTFQPHFKLRLFNASGGVFAVPGLDDSATVKKEWDTWYRRNRMGSDYLRIDGHKGELFNIIHKKEIEADPAILAPYEGERKYAIGAKIDPTYKKGVELFTSWLAVDFAKYQQQMPSFLPFKKYQSADMGDGLNYCHTPACEAMFPTVSDQSIFLTNEAAKKIRLTIPGAGISTLAYTERADTPSLPIEPNVQVMVVPSAFQRVTIPSDLIQRWAIKHPTISQYDFLNIGVWHFDHPFFNLTTYHEYMQWMKALRTEGMSFETSLSSMASGLQQYFLMQYLAQPFDNMEQELHRLCVRLYGNATVPVKRILNAWYFSDVHLKTSMDKPAFYPDELAGFIHDIREAENTKGLLKIERERIFLLKAYIVYLCGFYELYHEPLPASSQVVKMTNLKAEGLLQYTWGLYQHKIFHNTQLNDLLKKSTDDPAQWDFRKGSRVKNIKPLSPDQVEKSFVTYENKYGAHYSDVIEFDTDDMRYLAKYAADSVRIKTIDEKAFGSYTYPLKIYAPRAGKIEIRYMAGKGEERKSINQPVAVMALEESGGELLSKHLAFRNNETGWVEFTVPSEGHYTLQLGQFHATPVQWVIVPGGNLLYLEKKQVIHHAIQLMEEKGSAYANTQLGIWNNKQPFAFQPVFENVKNTISFFTAEGKPTVLTHNPAKNNYLVAASPTSQPFSFYKNEVFRWPATMQNIPPYFFFLKN